MKDTAYLYNSYGIRVLPVKNDKTPASKTWKDGVSPEEFDGAWGIALVCGEKSGNIEILDFDNHQGDARQRLIDFQKECEMWPDDAVVVQTGGGGFHVIYRCDKISGNQKLASVPIKNNHGKIIPDAVIETRGEGGYAVTDPSQGYKVVRGSLSAIPNISADVRDDLIEVARSFNKWVDIKREPIEEKGRPGDIYNESSEAISDAKEALKDAGWVHIYGNRWRRPDKNKGHSATFGGIGDNVFYVFSPNAYPFEQDKCYLPFQVVGLLKYGGDFKRFAGELAERYDTSKVKIPVNSLLKRARVDLSKPVMRPPIALSVRHTTMSGYSDTRMFTVGNFSAIIGKAKSKKTFFLNMISSVFINEAAFPNKFIPSLPEGKRGIVYFDTEQGDYDVYNTAKRIVTLAGSYRNFEMYQLREFEPRQRCEIIDEYLKENPQVGFVVIDGIADLGTAINDEEEATRVTSLLMRWTKQYKNHVTCVIHQNKMNEFATGHLGSYIMKKAEIIISVTKDSTLKERSLVSCDMSRGADFDDFYFRINENGIPELDGHPEVIETYEQPPF